MSFIFRTIDFSKNRTWRLIHIHGGTSVFRSFFWQRAIQRHDVSIHCSAQIVRLFTNIYHLIGTSGPIDKLETSITIVFYSFKMTSTLPVVPESKLKASKRLARIKSVLSKRRLTKKLVIAKRTRENFLRAESYAKQYANAERSEIVKKREAKKAGNYYIPGENRLAFVIRIRGYVYRHIFFFCFSVFFSPAVVNFPSYFIPFLVSTKWHRRCVRFCNCSDCVKSTMAFSSSWIRPPSICCELLSLISHGAIRIWNRSVDWSTSVAMSSTRVNVFQSPTILLSSVNWRSVLTSNAWKIWCTKYSRLDRISNTHRTFCGPSNWIHRPVDGARRTITLSKAVTSVTVKTKSMFCWDVWFNRKFDWTCELLCLNKTKQKYNYRHVE